MRQDVNWVPATTMDDVLKAALPAVFERVAAVGGSVPELDRDRLPVAASA